MWLMLETINTIGFGEVHPETLWGRVFLTIACFWGVSIYSLFVVSLQTFTIFQEEDNMVYRQIVHESEKFKLNEAAGYTIKAFLLYTVRRKKQQKKTEGNFTQLFDFLKYSIKFHQKRM